MALFTPHDAGVDDAPDLTADERIARIAAHDAANRRNAHDAYVTQRQLQLAHRAVLASIGNAPTPRG